MGIILYQSAIALILITTRIVAPQGLLVAALACTAFTFFNVSWAPLFVLQMVVIWSLFAILSKIKSA